MSELDDFARNTIGPTLRPGEVMLAIGWMGKGVAWRTNPERYFAIGTNQRFVVIQTGAGLLFGTPKMGNEGVVGYELAHASNAISQTIGPLTFNVAFDAPQGRVAYAVPSPSIVGAKSVEGHPDFVEVYLPWLCRHVAAGTLRTAEGASAAAAEWHDRARLAQANDRYRVSIGDKRVKALHAVKWPMVLAIICLGLIPIGWAYKKEAAEQVGYVQRSIDFALENRATAEYDVDARVASERGRLAQLESKQTKGTLMQAGGGVGAIGFLVLAVVLTSRKRATAMQAARAPG